MAAPRMKLHIKLTTHDASITKDIIVDKDVSLSEFRRQIFELFQISGDNLYISLNRQHYRSCEGATTLQNEGFVNGDTIYASTDHCSQHSMMLSSEPPNISTNIPAVDRPFTSDAVTNIDTPPSDTCLTDLKQKVDSLNPKCFEEMVVAFIHQILLCAEFKEIRFSDELPPDWRLQLSTNYSLYLTYCHKFSARTLNLTFQVLHNRLIQASSSDVQLIGMNLTGLCVNVDDSIFLLDFNVLAKDFDFMLWSGHHCKMIFIALTDGCTCHSNDEKLLQFLGPVKRRFIQPLVSNLIGYRSESRLLHLPADVQLELAKKLPFKSFFSLCLVSWKMWNDLYSNDNIWKMLLRRDFSDAGKYDCYRERYIELYIGSRSRFSSCTPSKRTGPHGNRSLPERSSNAGFNSVQGIIGGPDDANPPLPNPYNNPFFPRPRSPPANPFDPGPGRPRIFPRHPAMQPEPRPRPDGPGFGGFL